MVMDQSSWHCWFAWYPVEVDAYHEDEIRRGNLRYPVWMRLVERRLTGYGIRSDPEEYRDDTKWWQYRLIRSGK